MDGRKITVEPGQAESPLNCWYVGAFSREVQAGKLFSRRILDKPVVFYRDAEGQTVALFDRCPHRGMPLSMGALLNGGDRLQCVYHGFEFNAAGRCTLIPSQDIVPPRMAVRSYPVVEKWKWIWIWMGDPAMADPALIPDHHYLGFERPDWFSHDSIYLPLKANYLLPFENLVDATHITYLHHGMIDNGDVARHPYRLEQDGGVVRMIRVFENETQGDMVYHNIGMEPGTRLDRTLLLESFAPSLCNVSMSFVRSDDKGMAPRQSHLLIALTPETTTSTHQFVATSANNDSGAPPEVRDAALTRLLSEDVVAIEAIQNLFDSLPPEDRVEFSQKADEGAIRTRRYITQMIEGERSRMAAE